MKDYYIYEIERTKYEEKTTNMALIAGMIGLLGFDSDDEDN